MYDPKQKNISPYLTKDIAACMYQKGDQHLTTVSYVYAQ